MGWYAKILKSFTNGNLYVQPLCTTPGHESKGELYLFTRLLLT